MDAIQQLIHQDTKYNIIGSHLLQIMLSPEEKINTMNTYIQYFTPNLQLTHKRMFLFSKQQYTTIINKSKESAYVGLQGKTGKIMVIDATIFMNYYIRKSSILAYNGQVELQSATILNCSFKKVVLNHQTLHKLQLLFVHTDGIIIDKELGATEKMIVKMNQIIIMSDQVKWKYHSWLNEQRIIQLQGPGRVFLEILPDPPMAKLEKNFAIFIFYFIALLCALPFLLEIGIQ